MKGSEAENKDHTKINDEIVVVDSAGGRPKSKRELRLERKAAKKRKAEESSSSNENENEKHSASGGGGGGSDDNDNQQRQRHDVLDKEEYLRLKKLRKAELREEEEKRKLKELREEKKLRKRKKLNRELNAKGGPKKKPKTTTTTAAANNELAVGESSKPKTKKPARSGVDRAKEERDITMNAFRSVVYGTSGASTSSPSPSSTGNDRLKTTRLGVQYEDTVIGKGKLVKEGRPVTVRYELTGGKFGAVLDSSPKFTFALGMGEVIRGWDIGLEGMREGGRRKLIVPPKAGYGGKDIGAGPGALLHFDITVLSCGK